MVTPLCSCGCSACKFNFALEYSSLVSNPTSSGFLKSQIFLLPACWLSKCYLFEFSLLEICPEMHVIRCMPF